MKTMVMMWIAVLSLAGLAQSAAVVENAPRNYEMALKSGNASVVESALFHVVKFKIFYTEQDTEKLAAMLEKLASDGETGAIRYKAYLAGQFLNDPALLAKIEKQDYKDGDRFFRMLAEELEKELLAER
ncbi:MAG: hypothetical protein HUU32_05390 [Calditrichaceae bacterium]|nr:hypothetical protein [Calditrichia bacterium]NUQ40809.1 hypothetical protein [Calditrichaceae bacterium]